jgi:hypothetical protein
MPILVVLAVPDLPVSTNHVYLKWFPRDVDHTSHSKTLLIEVSISESSTCFLLSNQIIEVDITILGTGSKCHVIFKPINAPHSTHMVLALIVRRTVSSVEVKHTDSIGTCSYSK